MKTSITRYGNSIEAEFNGKRAFIRIDNYLSKLHNKKIFMLYFRRVILKRYNEEYKSDNITSYKMRDHSKYIVMTTRIPLSKEALEVLQPLSILALKHLKWNEQK